MKPLSDSWLTDGLLDVEYKQYILLSYLQEVRKDYLQWKIYPALADVIRHYTNLQDFLTRKNDLEKSFRQTLKQINPETLKLEYSSEIDSAEWMQQIEEIIQFALPKIQTEIEIGKERYETVEAQLELIPVGIEPVYKTEGYLFLRFQKQNWLNIYRYTVSIFRKAEEVLRGIHLEWINRIELSVFETYEHIKQQLIRFRKDLPLPATYAIESKKDFPIEETLLPIAKRKLIRSITI